MIETMPSIDEVNQYHRRQQEAAAALAGEIEATLMEKFSEQSAELVACALAMLAGATARDAFNGESRDLVALIAAQRMFALNIRQPEGRCSCPACQAAREGQGDIKSKAVH